MSLKKLWTALRGAANEGVEAVADTQAIRILDQEMREAKKELQGKGGDTGYFTEISKAFQHLQAIHCLRGFTYSDAQCVKSALKAHEYTPQHKAKTHSREI